MYVLGGIQILGGIQFYSHLLCPLLCFFLSLILRVPVPVHPHFSDGCALIFCTIPESSYLRSCLILYFLCSFTSSISFFFCSLPSWKWLLYQKKKKSQFLSSLWLLFCDLLVTSAFFHICLQHFCTEVVPISFTAQGRMSCVSLAHLFAGSWSGVRGQDNLPLKDTSFAFCKYKVSLFATLSLAPDQAQPSFCHQLCLLNVLSKEIMTFFL